MEGFYKAPLKDHEGKTILPWTSADAVSESPDRRFVDHIEKTFLSRWGGNIDTADMLIANSEAIRALATQEPTLTRLIDEFPSNFSEKMIVVDNLLPLVGYTSQLIENLDAPPVVFSETSHQCYALQVDDTVDPPRIILIKQEQQFVQPTYYEEGDTWVVSNSSPDVVVPIPVDSLVYYNKRKTVLTFEEGLALEQVLGPVRDNIINGVQNESVTATDDNIPQAFVSFNVRNSLESYFAKQGLEKTITGFTSSILSQPMTGTTRTLTQTYMNSNVVQPVREATKKNDYTSNTFQYLTWSNSLNPEFIGGWLNNKGQAGLSTFGDTNTSISIAKPTLDLYIKNPYIGKTLVATKAMDEKFSILDWKIKE